MFTLKHNSMAKKQIKEKPRSFTFQDVSFNLDWVAKKTETQFTDEFKSHRLFKDNAKLLKEAWRVLKDEANGKDKQAAAVVEQ